MSDPIYVYVGTYATEAEAEADLKVVHGLYKEDSVRTYDAAIVVKEADGKLHVHHREDHPRHEGWHGAAVGALVGILFPPGLIADTIIGAAAGELVGHLWHGLSRDDLKDLGETLDAGEANLVVISTSEFDHDLAAQLKAEEYIIKELEKADAKAFEHKLRSLKP